MTSPDLRAASIEKIADLFPGVVTELIGSDGSPVKAIDFDQLRQELSDHLVEGPQERYHLDWPGKRQATLAANAPIAKTLRPVRADSVDFNTTKNLFIEGDNLDALKLLQESYLGKVKLIYIDPPYNTGNDFVYNDDFTETAGEYLARSGQTDDSGTKLIANPESNGRFHSDWLSMIYPRLRVARNLLTDDGFIAVSIDDAEFSALKLLLDAVFGSSNEIATLVWDRNRKNDARYFSVGHEYMLIYARNKAILDEAGTRLREAQPGITEAKDFFQDLVDRHADDWDTIQREWRTCFATLPAGDERRKLGRYSKVGPRGPFRDDADISWPGGGGPSYEVLHPTTGQPCKTPEGGWRYAKKEAFDQAVADGRVVFGTDENTLPRQIRYLFESTGLVMGSVHYSYAQTAAMDFQALMGGRVFDNPKNWKDIRRIIEYLSGPDDLICDFFAGSATTAHAIIDLNAKTGSRRRWMLVQLPEAVSAKSGASSAGYVTIADIARERIKRAGALALTEGNAGEGRVDIGFRALKVDTTNMADVWRSPGETEQRHLSELEGSVKTGRTGEDLLFQVLLDWGLELTVPISVEEIEQHEVFVVDDGALIACFDTEVSQELVRAIAKCEPLRAVFCDSGFASDDARLNAEQIFREVSPSTDVKAI